jgi:uncharacterized protein (DUF488 family)
MAQLHVFTVGHSTHPLEELVDILRAHGADQVVDIRKMAGSRRNPQFGEEALAASLPTHGVGYQRLEALGGLRRTRRSEPTVNGAWRNASFRSYADYMQTEDFARGVDDLLDVATRRHVAIMCAEAVPWRCHRSLVGDALVVRGVEVLDIMSRTSATPHTLTSFARVDGLRVWYPATPENPGLAAST